MKGKSKVSCGGLYVTLLFTLYSFPPRTLNPDTPKPEPSGGLWKYWFFFDFRRLSRYFRGFPQCELEACAGVETHESLMTI